MIKLVTFGETMVQYNARYVGGYREEGEYLEDCAGAESNVAVDLGRLGVPGMEITWVSRLGDDAPGDLILTELTGRIRVFASKYVGQHTGISYLNHYKDGEHVKTYHRKDSAASRLTFQEVKPHLEESDLLHLTGITPALSETCRETVFDALRYAVSSNLPVSLDLNFRPQLWKAPEARSVFDEMLEFSSILKLGYDEAETVWAKGWSPAEYARYFQSMNGGLVVLTLGSGGALACDGKDVISHSGFSVEVLDPVGAGDAFVAGLLGGIFRRMRPETFLDLASDARRPVLEEALRIANVCGALTCTRRGDTAAMPTVQEVDEFLASNRTDSTAG